MDKRALETGSLPGWTLPSVVPVGAAQVMTNVHRVKPDQKGVIVGVNVPSVAIARELQLAGIEVAGLVLPEANSLTEKSDNPKTIMKSMARLAQLVPSFFIRFGSKLLKGALWNN